MFIIVIEIVVHHLLHRCTFNFTKKVANATISPVHFSQSFEDDLVVMIPKGKL